MDSGAARDALVDDLVAAGVVRSAAVERAMRAVPRELFVPAAAQDRAYADEAIVSACDDEGRPISSVSQPTMVALMLEALQVRPGDRVLEIGTGSGYNAALLADLVAPGGEVVTVELEPWLAEEAAARLQRLGLGSITVVVGDGAAGHPATAPFDGVIVTAGAPEASPAWVEQLRMGRRLVVPLVDVTGMGVAVTYERTTGGLHELSRTPCGFVRMR